MMMKLFVLVILVTACFLAAVLNLAAENRFRKYIMSAAIVCAVAVGAIFYGAGYAYCQGFSVASLMRALLALCRMFGGVNDFSAVSELPLFKSQALYSFFWFGHFCAFYVTASAAIATLGDKLLRQIRVTMLRFGPLLVIYGINDNSVAYAKSMIDARNRSVLFIDPDGNTPYESTIKSFGAVIEKGSKAMSPDGSFLKHIGVRPGSRKVELAALHTDWRRNYEYAASFLDALTNAGISPDQTSLLISGTGESSSALQAQNGPGYGSVLAFNDHGLTSRLIIKEIPPADALYFDAQGSAAEDFHAVIVGFGLMGRAMLDSLVCNAQFCGSNFRVDIFDPNPQNGYLHGHELMQQYDICFHRTDGKSEEFYSFLSENSNQIRYIALCSGSRDENAEIARDLLHWYEGSSRIPILVQAVCGSYICMKEGRTVSTCSNLFTADNLDMNRIDSMAMQIHHMYTGGPSAEEDWAGCGYWGRISSRAAADYYPAVLRALGKTAQDVLSGDWPPGEEILENLAISEHLRWCAFHYVNGYRAMPEEEFRSRAEMWRKEKEEKGSSSVSLTKDTGKRLHACLIPWEELDALSEKEFQVSGRRADYKQMDRNNVIAVRDVLEAYYKDN